MRPRFASLALTAILGLSFSGCDSTAPLPTEAAVCEVLLREGPPDTRREDVVDVIHGVEVRDSYRWLEDNDDPDVVAWANAQDAFARGVLGSLPRRDELRRRLRQLLDIPVVSIPSSHGGRLFYFRREAGRDLGTWMVREGERGKERVLVDPLELDKNGELSLRGLSPSPDGKYVAYTVHRRGADQGVLRIRSVDTGRDTGEVIAGGRYAHAAWEPTGRGFYYTWVPDDPNIDPPELPAHQQVRYHELGTPPSEDRGVYGPTGDAQTFISVDVTDDGQWLVLHQTRGWKADSLRVKRVGEDGPWRPLFDSTQARASASAYRGKFYVHTNDGAPRFRVVEIDPERPQRRHWREVVPESSSTLQMAGVVGGRLILKYLLHVAARVEVRDLEGRKLRDLEVPAMGSVPRLSGKTTRDELFYAVSSFDQPPEIRKVSVRTGETQTWYRSPVEVDTSRFKVRQRFFESRDGTRVPMFIVHSPGIRYDGSHPTLLTGYGGFGLSITPDFSAVAALWIEHGGVFAVANLRGGGEYGEPWHDAGKGAHKQNTFDDFLAAADELIDSGFTSPRKLAVMGGSNGGLLVGAAMTQAPQKLGAVVCAVPLLDMIRFHRFGMGSTWVPEYGSAEDPQQFRTLLDYSPLQAVREDADYPPLLMLSADNDDRVHPMHARKFVAEVQHADPSNTTLLRVERGAGHGGSPKLSTAIEAKVDTLAFLFSQLGM